VFKAHLFDLRISHSFNLLESEGLHNLAVIWLDITRSSHSDCITDADRVEGKSNKTLLLTALLDFLCQIELRRKQLYLVLL
jgi:hypothetical protein